jgi:RNA polymerase sigma-70 factor, ECF subfamily
MAEPEDVTQLLIDHRKGDPDAFQALVAVVYQDLRRIARIQLSHDRQREVLNTTALVHESYLRLADAERLSIQDRAHFLAIAAVAMRRVIVDFARERAAQKRGGGQPHGPLDEGDAVVEAQAIHILAVHDALSRLERIDPLLTRIVDCRFFAGYSEQETADALGLTLRTAQRAWARARAWLQVQLGEWRNNWQSA